MYRAKLLLMLALARMDDDTATANRLIGAIVVNEQFLVAYLLPDLDPERVRLTIPGPQHELVVAGAVDGAGSFELGSGTALIHYQPLIAAAVEVQICRLEYELRAAGWDSCSILVLGDKTKVSPACKRWFNCVGSRG